MSLERGIGLLGWLPGSHGYARLFASVEIGSAVPVGAKTASVAPAEMGLHFSSAFMDPRRFPVWSGRYRCRPDGSGGTDAHGAGWRTELSDARRCTARGAQHGDETVSEGLNADDRRTALAFPVMTWRLITSSPPAW